MLSTPVGNPAYGQPNNESFCNLMERVQYNAALAIADGVKGNSNLGFSMNLALNLWNSEDATGDCVL